MFFSSFINWNGSRVSRSLPLLIVTLPCAWMCLLVVLVSSFILNLLQLIALCFGARRVSQKLASEWYNLNVFTVEVSSIWSGVELRLSGTPVPGSSESSSSFESALMIGNHCPGLDFLPAVCFAQRSIGCGSVIALMKSSLLLVPALGWTNLLQGAIFMRRSWQHDKVSVDLQLQRLNSGEMPSPFWVGLFPEGTRISKEKRIKSIEYARLHHLPVLHNVLLPRTRGFVFIVQRLKASLNAMYDVTIAYDGPPFRGWDFLIRGRFLTQALHMHVERIDRKKFQSLSDEKLTQFLFDMFALKDMKLTKFYDRGYFGDHPGPVQRDLLRVGVRFIVWCIVTSLLFASMFGTIIAYTMFTLTGVIAFISGLRAFSKVKRNRKLGPIAAVIRDERKLDNKCD